MSYYELSLQSRGGDLVEVAARVDAIERSIGVSIPGGYRQFLLDTNGAYVDIEVDGELQPAMYPEADEGCLANLLPSNEVLSFFQGNYFQWVWDYIPKDFLPIGDSNGAYSDWLLGLYGSRRGKVYMLQRMSFQSNEYLAELDDVLPDILPIERYIFKVADSWEEFLTLFEPLDKFAQRSHEEINRVSSRDIDRVERWEQFD